MNVPAGLFHRLEHKFDKGGYGYGRATEVYICKILRWTARTIVLAVLVRRDERLIVCGSDLSINRLFFFNAGEETNKRAADRKQNESNVIDVIALKHKTSQW